MAEGKVKTPRWMVPLEPPDCPQGWATGPPDFVGVGAQRSGTSWWYRVIEAHQNVARIKGENKELHYFDRFWTGEVPDDFIDTYHRLFPRPPGSITGEWTPRYMFDFWSLRLLRQAAPEARILILLRDPVERYRSGLARHLRLAGQAQTPVNLAQLADAVTRGLYRDQLRRVFEVFTRDQVLVLQYERCVQDPLGQLGVTCRFLGLEAPSELPDITHQRKRAPNPKAELRDDMRADLVARLRDDVMRTLELCPEIDPSLWPNFSPLGGGAVSGGGVDRAETAVAGEDGDARSAPA